MKLKTAIIFLFCITSLVGMSQVLPNQGCSVKYLYDDNGSRIQRNWACWTNQAGVPKSVIDSLELTAFPNPTTDLLTVNVKGITSGTGLDIIDQKGSILLTHRLQANTAIVDASSLAKGVYWVRLTHDHGTVFTKFIKQ